MDANETMNQVGHEASQRMDDVKNKLSDVSNRMVERSRAAASSTDQYVHEYAWSSVALAALLGVAIGMMIRRS
jgi:ElaB/YqjD/DUF883 family membrane-anchored ribosome-binding protein